MCTTNGASRGCSGVLPGKSQSVKTSASVSALFVLAEDGQRHSKILKSPTEIPTCSRLYVQLIA